MLIGIITSASETTRKPPVPPPAEAKSALRKRKKHGYLSHWRSAVKNCFPTQYHNVMSVKSAIGCWVMVKKRLKWQPSAFLNFLNVQCSYLVNGCQRVPNVLLCTKFHQNRMIFRWHMAIYRFAMWPLSAMLNFRNLESMSRDLYHYAILLPCATV